MLYIPYIICPGHIIQAIQDDPMIDSQLSTFGIGLAMDNKHHHPSTLTHADSHLFSGFQSFAHLILGFFVFDSRILSIFH